jgi:adenine-specific DNA-methyltransferase
MRAQLEIFDLETKLPRPPSTRYQGSKAKLLSWIWDSIKQLEFHSVLDAFGGTGSVSYHLKSKGKAVIFNDYLRFNWLAARAFIENNETLLDETDLDVITKRHTRKKYDNFIERTFEDIYFLSEENQWLDTVCQNIPLLADDYKRAIAYHALFQSCIIKRPYNLFHRKNLYMRTAEVQRGFGNKATWDTPFEKHFKNFVSEVNEAIFNSGVRCNALSMDALDVPGKYDLVYIDTPYLNSRGIGVDYFDFYHFLEGIADYRSWDSRIDYKRKHRPLKANRSLWSDAKQINNAFIKLFEKFSDSILVVSYRSDGIPSEEELVALLRRVKPRVDVLHYGEYRYVLSTNSTSKEILLIAY